MGVVSGGGVSLEKGSGEVLGDVPFDEKPAMGTYGGRAVQIEGLAAAEVHRD